MKKTILLMIAIFLVGWFFNSAYSTVIDARAQVAPPVMANLTDVNGSYLDPMNASADGILGVLDLGGPKDKASPADFVNESDIHVYDSSFNVDGLKGLYWARFTCTKSMDPVFDCGNYAIEKTLVSTDDIHVGDIVSYRSDYADGVIIHRVVEIGNDSDGWYCRFKGDNNPTDDPGKVRFDQLNGVVVAIIY
jgi:hypothetical protein